MEKFNGSSGRQNSARAYDYYCEAAREGYPDAAHSIAWMYMNGRGLSADDAKAGYWLKTAADAGDEHAARLLKRLTLPTAGGDENCTMPPPAAVHAALQGDPSLSEPATSPEARLTTALPPEQTSNTETTKLASACYRIGPVDGRKTRKTVTDWLLDRTTGVQGYMRHFPYGLIFQVYRKPLKDRAQALKTIAGYRIKWVQDLQLIATGVLTNGVSLGAYRSETQALARVRQLRALTIDAAYRTQDPVHRQHWVRFRSNDTMSEQIRAKFPTLRVEPSTCPAREKGTDPV